MGFGAGLEHHDAGVFRHPTKRKICRASALMATGAFSFRPPSLPMARAEMHRKSRRVYGNGHGVEMTTQTSYIIHSIPTKMKECVVISRTHAHTHVEFQRLGRLRSRVGRQRRWRRVAPDFFRLSWPPWPSERTSQGEVVAQMAMSGHLQALRLGMILEVDLRNIAIFRRRKNPKWIRG